MLTRSLTRLPPRPTIRAFMKSGITPRSLILLFPVVLVLYFGVFYGLEHLRQRRGPWEVEFTSTPQGEPMLVVNQSALGVRDLKLVFRGERATNEPGRVRFDRVQRPVPFGRVIYEDLTFLPGVVTFDLFGHEVELLPRVLIANKREIPWPAGAQDSSAIIDFWPTNKPAQPPSPPKKRPRQDR